MTKGEVKRFLWKFAVGLLLGYLLATTYEIVWYICFYTPPVYERQETPEERLRFKRLIRKHGDVVVVDWPRNPYFIRDGKRCSFK